MQDVQITKIKEKLTNFESKFDQYGLNFKHIDSDIK